MPVTRRASTSPITPSTPIPQVHAAMRTIITAIKDAPEAKSYLLSKGWVLPGENVNLEILARTLFAAVADTENKLPTKTTNPVLAVAYLITKHIEDGIRANMAKTITQHLLDSLIPITTDIQTKLGEHLQAVTDSNKAHEVLNEKLQLTQEKLDKTSLNVNLNARTYSQVAATPPQPTLPNPPALLPPPPHQSHPPITPDSQSRGDQKSPSPYQLR
jgi:hypothetical protein